MKRIYIARDAGDALYLYSKPPEKKDEYWSIAGDSGSGYVEISEYQHLPPNDMFELFDYNLENILLVHY